MRLTKQTGHAIRILIDCALAKDELVKVAGVSERLGVTKQNVFKIVHILSHAGFLSAVRGPNGGVRLAKPATSIRIGDVVRAIEVTRVQVEGGGRGRKSGENDPASINAMFGDALSAFISVLDQHTLAELANQNTPIGITDADRETDGGSSRGAKARAKKPAARALRRS
ncbi:BadM/Rrf2 family transcriptional regulator [Hyphomicrobium denitrificans 1NES1]|uniref:BadM/Rrf2 family transcriptional regulator n=1 Tax=Hyphomicrobium denitrificans 1NES1 TaxID=670307 RepID=N0B2U6_9HYPH|nr:Rrf2 family transcriptional regulator [Hyphomicrobium denitrificans]AGK56492.1 BadM/Rrf2 family transcriptional regulator [Hyphomicrobium denitrificans 1NES1]